MRNAVLMAGAAILALSSPVVAQDMPADQTAPESTASDPATSDMTTSEPAAETVAPTDPATATAAPTQQPSR